MPRKRSRGTGYLGTDKGLKELAPRLGLDNVSRSQSTEPHNRRKPVEGSVGDAEIDGRLSNASLPVGNVVGNAQGQVNSNTQIEYKPKSIPGGALVPDYATTASVDNVRQSVSGVQNQIKQLKRTLQQLQAGKKN